MTPHINKRGLVALDIEEEVSEISGEIVGSEGTAPTFHKRNIVTSIVVPDGQTVAIGGLIEKKEDTSGSGIPLLSKIPLLGYLFKYSSKKITKTEMVIFLTPHVVTDPTDVQAITEDYKENINKLRALGTETLKGKQSDTQEDEMRLEERNINIEIEAPEMEED
jgi:general secretion pathway protein D